MIWALGSSEGSPSMRPQSTHPCSPQTGNSVLSHSFCFHLFGG